MHRRLGVTVASLAVVGVLLVSVEALAIDLGSVGSIRGTLKAYTSSSGNEIAGSVSKSDMKGRPIVGEENGRYAIDVGGTRYWVRKHQVSKDRNLAVPRGCQNLATGFSGNSASRGAGKGCAE